MKRKIVLFVLAAAALCAAGAYAQAPAADQTQAAPQTAPMTKEQKEAKRKAAWEAGVKTDCAAEIAAGGVCAGMDFGSGLKECLEKNRKTLSDGCKATLPHKKSMKAKKTAAPAEGAQTPATQTPTQAPATTTP